MKLNLSLAVLPTLLMAAAAQSADRFTLLCRAGLDGSGKRQIGAVVISQGNVAVKEKLDWQTRLLSSLNEGKPARMVFIKPRPSSTPAQLSGYSLGQGIQRPAGLYEFQTKDEDGNIGPSLFLPSSPGLGLKTSVGSNLEAYSIGECKEVPLESVNLVMLDALVQQGENAGLPFACSTSEVIDVFKGGANDSVAAESAISMFIRIFTRDLPPEIKFPSGATLTRKQFFSCKEVYERVKDRVQNAGDSERC